MQELLEEPGGLDHADEAVTGSLALPARARARRANERDRSRASARQLGREGRAHAGEDAAAPRSCADSAAAVGSSFGNRTPGQLTSGSDAPIHRSLAHTAPPCIQTSSRSSPCSATTSRSTHSKRGSQRSRRVWPRSRTSAPAPRRSSSARAGRCEVEEYAAPRGTAQARHPPAARRAQPAAYESVDLAARGERRDGAARADEAHGGRQRA